MEEKAGEEEEREGREAQGEASEETPQVSAKGKDPGLFQRQSQYRPFASSSLAGFTENNLCLLLLANV